MRNLVILLVATLLLLAVVGCAQLRANVKSVIKVEVYTETGAAYGYVNVSLIDENGRSKYSQNVNERGVAIFERVEAGTYGFEVVNVNGVKLEVISPDSVSVTVGRTTTVELKVKRATSEEGLES
jgi:hypothetical protein